jgi:GNAT superfamily N-acetyltransferase
LNLRPATAADVGTLADIWIDSAFGPDAPMPEIETAYLAHEVASGTVLIAEDAGRAIGFGALITRGSVSNLAELFVRRDVQSKGAGAALLGRLFAGAAPRLFTVAAHDPRALALYVRHGLVPRWPHLYLEAPVADLDVPPSRAVVVSTSWDDRDWIACDARLAGRDRSVDHVYFRGPREGMPVWFRVDGRTIGYGAFQRRAKDMVALGPVGVDDPAFAVPCVLAAAHAARALRPVVHIQIPGPHPALAPLLQAGFRIVDQDTFMANPGSDPIDPARYVPSSSEFF